MPLPPPPRGGQRPRAKYAEALKGGHRVVPLIHEVFGGLAKSADAFMRELSVLRKHALGTDSVHATWAARSFGSFWRQRLSIAIQSGTARELVRVIAAGEAEVRKAIGRWGRVRDSNI